MPVVMHRLHVELFANRGARTSGRFGLTGAERLAMFPYFRADLARLEEMLTGYTITAFICFAPVPRQTFNSAATTKNVTGLTQRRPTGSRSPRSTPKGPALGPGRRTRLRRHNA